ncbi:MAG TPA: CopL family metal-binding regulatory protein [Lysobacter sp.]
MSPRAVLLRVLLCISLVLNGWGYASASTQMHHMHATAEEAAPGTAALANAAMPCHALDEHGDNHSAWHAAADMASATTACDDTDGGKSKPDCCTSAQCACDCLQHATATPAHAPALPAVIARAADARAMSPDRPAPTLASPIRPPIV